MPVGLKALGETAQRRLRKTPPWRIDAVLATFLVLVGLITTTHAAPANEPRDGVAIALLLAATVPYYARRLAPLLVFAMSHLAVTVIFCVGYPGGGLPFVLAIGAYTVGA